MQALQDKVKELEKEKSELLKSNEENFKELNNEKDKAKKFYLEEIDSY